MIVFVLAGHAPSLVNFRGPLLRAIKAAGHEVTASAPRLTENEALAQRLRMDGINPVDAPIDRTGLNPLRDLWLMLFLWRQMRREQADVFLGYTIKPVIYGLLAAWLARVPRRYALITGLGYAFTGEATGLRGLVQRVSLALYRMALARAHGIIFQNCDDAALFGKLGLIPQQVPVSIVNGSGVDLEHYGHQPLPPANRPMTFLLIARLLKVKGIAEFAEAAAIVKENYPEARFVLVGGHDSNPDAIDLAALERWVAAGTLEWLGEQDDVRPFLAHCHVFVLPSYREGTPRSVLEAMATGRAIITTDAPGCRETVIDGENGFLVPVKDSEALARAIRGFLEEPGMTVAMGKRSLDLARRKYDVDLVNRAMFEAMGLE